MLAEAYRNTHAVVHLEMDSIRARILPDAAHTREDRAVAYRAMHFTAERLLELGHDVIVNAGYGHAEDRDEVIALTRRTGAELYQVEFTVPLETALERNRKRRQQHPGLDLTDERVTDLVENFPYTHAGLTIDSTWPIEDCLARLEHYINSKRPSG